MDNKIPRILHYSLIVVAAILILSILVPGRAIAVTSVAQSSTRFGWQYEYDIRGRIASITDPASKKTKFRYTQNSRGGLSGMTQKLPGGSTVKFRFDRNGRRTEMVDSVGTVRYTYDKFGRLTKVHRDGAPSVSYGYDTLNRIKSIRIGTGFELKYAYDFRGRPEKLITPEGNILFSYNGKTGEVTRRLPNGITTRWTNLPDGRLESITHTSAANRPIAQYRYTYRLDGMITSIKELTPSGVQTRRYIYDTAQRLVSTSGTNGPKTGYTYDKVGNRAGLRRQGHDPVTARYDWAGTLTHYDGKPVLHDKAGNLTSYTGGSKSFTFDDTGLLKTVSLKNASINYRYDGDGFLVSRSSGTSQQKFLPDPLSDIWQPLSVKGPGSQVTFYIWDGASPLMAVTGKRVRYFLHDHLGSVRLVIDQAGEKIERYDYTPFGQPEKVSSGVDLQPGFAGLFFDNAASVYLTRARAYDPALGRFLQRDPEHRVLIGSQKDLSVYTYCGGDPVNYVDLSGAAPMPVGVPLHDRILNNFGRGSVWIGRNRSGGVMSYKKDSHGQFPLGDTRLSGINTIDKYARLHDTEYWVSTHLPKGAQVKVPAPGGKYEYFTSEGDSGLKRVNLRVMGKGLVAPHRLTPWSNKFSQGTKSPRLNKPVEYELKYDKRQKSMTILPYNDTCFPHNDTSNLKNHLTQKNWDGVATIAAKYPSPVVGAVDKFLGIATHVAGFHELRNINRANPGDLATKARNVSYGLGTVGVLAGGPVGLAAAAGSRLIDTGVAIGNAIRSQTMQNRAIGLIGLPHGRRSQVTGFQELRSHYGYFNVKGSSWESQGGWSLRNDHGSSSSNAWAKTTFTNYRLSSGVLMSGKQGMSDYRLETAGSLRRERKTYFSGNESFSGADFNRRYAEYEKTGVYRDSLNTSNFSGLSNAKVGGIRLTGAGNALNHLGGLEGIALDKTNDRLILIGKGERPINLPPLRIDDVVTIFRCVYLHGAAPSVTIDPISDKDTEKWMNVIHGEGTNNTYVGWVLYEADRIMKNYGLGKDNKTKKKIYSRVPGYRDFHAIGAVLGQRWERYWIVPASMKRTRGTTSELTMLDVPLKLMTEKMEWDGTKLVTARNPRPSKGATAYTKWFTSQYNKIAKEVKLLPPKHFGFEKPVAIYEELRRIALISGIAETLRDQNVPFPAWMYDYPVKPCISDSQTPCIKVTGKGYKVHGGVQLSPSVKNIHTFKDDMQVTQLAEIVHRKIASKPLFEPVTFHEKGKTYTAVALPGADTQRGGANMFSHNDLPVAVLKDAGIDLTRHFNSFYDPRGMFGRGWSLDHPRLRRQQQSVNRTERGAGHKTVYQLSSPLNSWSERFSNYEVVPDLGRKLMVPSRPGEMLGLADTILQVIGYQTKELKFRNGESWHFDKDGYLVGLSDTETIIIYERNKNHTISSVKSFVVKGSRAAETPRAELLLTYKKNSRRVCSIEARKSSILKDSLKATYIYNEHGLLVMVVGPGGTRQYTYHDGLVTSVTRDGEKLATFKYNDQGQVQQESRGEGRQVAYERVNTSYGTKVVATDATSNDPLETVEYDADMRLRGRTFEDGSSVAWREEENAQKTTITDPDGEGYTITDSNDGLHSTTKTTTGVTSTTDFDDKGRVTRAHVEGGSTIEQKWHSDGRLQSAVSDEQGVRPTYTGDGKLSSVVVTPPDQAERQRPGEYVKSVYDAEGRVTGVTDDAGSELQIEYDKSGQPSVIASSRDKVTITRDTGGVVRKVDTSWGFTEKYDYDKGARNLSQITLRQEYAGKPAEEASIELNEGLITRVRQPDGGETTLDYYKDYKQKGLLKKIQTPDELTLAYSYDKATRLTGIDIGDGNTPAYRVNYKYDKKGRLAGISYSPPAGR